jgi:hypothetical protein
MDNFESTRNSSGDIGTAELRDKMQKNNAEICSCL